MNAGVGGSRPTIPALAGAAAEQFADRIVVEDGNTRLTYAEIFEEARSFGAALAAAGIEPGDRVAIWAPNGARWVIALLGLSQAGAVLVPVNTRFKGGEAADILARSVAGLGDGFENQIEGLLIRFQLRRKASLVTDGGGVS